MDFGVVRASFGQIDSCFQVAEAIAQVSLIGTAFLDRSLSIVAKCCPAPAADIIHSSKLASHPSMFLA